MNKERVREQKFEFQFLDFYTFIDPNKSILKLFASSVTPMSSPGKEGEHLGIIMRNWYRKVKGRLKGKWNFTLISEEE